MQPTGGRTECQRQKRQHNEKNYELESEYQDDSFFPFDVPDGAAVGYRIWAAKIPTKSGLRPG